MNKNLKKSLVFIAAATMVTPLVPVYANDAATTEKKDVVWYRNTFDNGTKDRVDIENDYVSVTFATNNNNLSTTVVVDGNTGVRTNPGAWNAKRTILIEPKTALSEGKYVVSWDTSATDNINGLGSDMWIGFNFSDQWQGQAMTYMNLETIELDDGTKQNTGKIAWGVDGFKANKGTLDPDEVNHFDYVFDYSEKTAKAYKDGTLVKTMTNIAEMKNFSFNLSGMLDYVDNVQMVNVNGENPEMTLTAAAGENYADVEFSTPVLMDGTFAIDGKNVTKTKWNGNTKVRLYTDGIFAVDEAVKVSANGIKGFFDTELKNSVATANAADETVIYYNTFDNGIADYVDFTSADWTVEKTPSDAPSRPTLTVSEKGNTGIRYAGECWAKKPTFIIKPATEMKKGILSISYDFKIDNSTVKTHNGDHMTFGLNMSMNYEGARVGYISVSSDGWHYVPRDTIGSWESDKNVNILLDETVHSLEYVLDFDNHSIYHYLDGQLVKTHNNLQYFKGNQFAISFAGGFAYFDNLKVKTMSANSFYAGKLETPVVGEKTISVVPSERIDATTLTADKVTVKKNGTEVTPTEVKSADFGNKIEITLPEVIGENENYVVEVGEIKSVSKYTMSTTVNTVSAKSEIKTVRLDGNNVIVNVENTTGSAITPTIFAATYKNNTLTGVKAVNGEEIAAGQRGETKLDISALSGDISVFAWDGMNPIIEVENIYK